MDKDKKKELANAYKTREVVGGVYCITCSGNQRKWLRATPDLEGARSRFEFSAQMKGTPEPAMQRECSEYGAESFSFEVLEELKKDDAQTGDEFKKDLNELLEMCREKCGQAD